MAGPLLEKCKALRRYLKDSNGVHFEPADLRRAQSLVASSGSSSSAGSSSIAVADSTAMAIAEGSTHVGDWMQYPECVRSKVCTLKDGQKWTKQLLEQRLDVLHRVRWCLCCGEVCQVRSDRNANWKDAKIIGDCHRKNTAMRNNGSAYPECNKTGVWKSVTQTQQLRNYRNNEIRKFQGRIAKCVAAASKREKKKSKRSKKN